MFNIKREIEKDFDREKNFQKIMNKAGQRKGFNWKYLFGPALAGIAIGVLLLNIGNTMKKENLKLEPENVVGNIENTQKVKKEWIIKKVSSNPELIVTPAIVIVKDWENATIAENFCNIKYDEKIYNGDSNIVISEDKLDKSLGEFETTALNAETSATVVIKINVYKIKSVAENVAIAVRLEEDNNYYVYRNKDYIAKNLSELINELNLKENASFDYINYYEWYGEERYDYNYIEFIDVEDEIIWNFINDLEKLDNKSEDKRNYKRLMGIHLNLESLGFGKYEFITILEDGYVSSTMSGNECYYIGEDKTEEFIEYIINQYDGYHYVWDEPNPVSDQSGSIMTIENKVGAEPQEKRITNQTTAPTNRTEAYNPSNTTGAIIQE